MASVNVSDQSHRYCDHCHHQLNLTLVPCNHCSEVAYCSQHCRSEARQSYHKYECGNTHTFRRILENVKKEGGKNKMGSTFDFSRLCFRVRFSDKEQILLSFYKFFMMFRQCVSILWSGIRRIMIPYLKSFPSLEMIPGTRPHSTV